MLNPSTEPTSQRVQQEDPKGCAVACLAMVSGRSYAEAVATFSDEAIARGVSDYGVVWWLNREGFWHRRSWMDGDWSSPVPTSGVAIMLTHDAHWVVLADGVVLDPARPEPLASYDFRQAIEVLHPAELASLRAEVSRLSARPAEGTTTTGGSDA